MKVISEITEKGIRKIIIELTVDDAGLNQCAAIQFAENIAKTKSHRARMRRLAMLIDKHI